MPSLPELAALFLIIFTYAGVAVGYVPRLRMNRASIALVGAAGLVAVGALSESQALDAIDLGTLILLGAMMVINNNLRISGFFAVVTYRIVGIARTPGLLLAVIIFASGILSAIFLNDTICLMMTPLVLDITLRLKRQPLPYLIGLATATNVGSTATITGNPQNIIIGQASDIPYVSFLLQLAPVALLGLGVCWLVIRLVFRSEFRDSLSTAGFDFTPPLTHTPLLRRSVGVVLALMIAFLIGLPTVTAAAVAAGALLISRVRPQKLFTLDWDLLIFFAGLFVVTGAVESMGISERFFELLAPLLNGGLAGFSGATAVLSNLVSNVPAVLLMRGEIAGFADPQRMWLALAMASTLAGNLTLLGSAANLIVAEIADRRGVELDFITYLRAGAIITVITLAIGVIWLSIL
ncbi:MAG: anion transporter [Anaerolineae bacterium]|nr:anion transporter [Anaerolineae bacterium]